MGGLYKCEVEFLEVLLKDNVLTNRYNTFNANCHSFIQILGHW